MAKDINIIRFEDILKPEKDLKPHPEKTKKTTQLNYIPRGLPKSGRVWKNPKSRFKSVIKTRGILKSNKPKNLLKLKDEINQAKQLTKKNFEARKLAIEEKKERRRENIKRQKENAQKSEIVQVIKNSAKIKRMRKKQLRYIEKRDTLKLKS